MGVEVYTPEEVAIMMNCSEGKAYKMIRAANLKRQKEKNLIKKKSAGGEFQKIILMRYME
ncbi:hypothetical protein [Fusobacterium ulcerans]|uniref:hypothetical protein n=1 Tax=Fusobacterium ulcerans TaxID=861 RepID=UPI0026F26E3F|nr:hypothetical protein [Fusobacterium ulcerans]